MLADESIEAIINTTPNSVHLETVRQAAEHGKHVFLDKPIANTVADGKAITEVCADAGIILSVGYQRRRECQFRWVKEQIDAGRFGKLVQADARQLLNVRELSTVIVKGTAQRDDAGNLTVLADGIYVQE